VERLVNCYAEAAPPEGKAPAALMRAPGIVTGATCGNGPGRGIVRFNGELYAVSGTSLYHVSNTYVATLIGTINGSDVVSFAANQLQLVICDKSGVAYTYDGTTLAQITDADWNNGVQCCDLDNYVLFRTGNSGQFFSSDLANASSYDALFFATAEGAADKLVGIITDHRQIVLAGEYSMELWFNAGGADFPFQRDVNGFLELGCAAGYTLAKADNSIYWLASDMTVRRLEGLTPVRVSQHGVEQAIATYDVSGAYAFGYSQGGHIFYVLTFPDQATWVYDATTREWHERASYALSRWRPCSAAYCYGLNFVQDYQTGKVGYLDTDTYTDWDDTQRLEATFPSVYNDGGRIFHQSFEVMAETGVGLVSGAGSDPQITLEMSDDGGRTWRTAATKSLGLLGKYRSRVRWEKLGMARDRVYRISISDAVKVVLSDAELIASGTKQRAA
jgi:hypothetical protein